MTHPTDPDVFGFGLESEVMITNSDFEALSHETLAFDEMRALINSIEAEPLDYLAEKYDASDRLPYYLEGYDVIDASGNIVAVDTKGVEIRTPVAMTIEECVDSLASLYGRLRTALQTEGMDCSCYSTHPDVLRYEGQRGTRTDFTWGAAEIAMTTYGLTPNVSLPQEIEAHLDRQHVRDVFEYFGPALVLLSGDTPVGKDGPWVRDGRVAVSERSYRRSFTRRPIYFHDDQNFRKEVKPFDMTNSLVLTGSYLSLSLGLVLDGRPVPFIPESFNDRNMREVSLRGYDSVLLDRQFREIDAQALTLEAIDRAGEALERNGQPTELLKPFMDMASTCRTPADDTLLAWAEEPDFRSLLRSRSVLIESW